MEKKGETHAHRGTLPLSTLLASCAIGREFLCDPVASRVTMADKGDDDAPKDQGKTFDQPAEKDGETAALIRQLLAALEKQQPGKTGNSSKGKP